MNVPVESRGISGKIVGIWSLVLLPIVKYRCKPYRFRAEAIPQKAILVLSWLEALWPAADTCDCVIGLGARLHRSVACRVSQFKNLLRRHRDSACYGSIRRICLVPLGNS